MKPSVRFDQVSKKYNLGLTRSSLPTVVANAMKGTINRAPTKSEEQRYLWALKDVSFELQRSQSMALVGANGAGKSTILKLIANITRPTSGHIEVDGQISALIELGSGFHPDLTGRENIYLNGTILGLSRREIDQRFDEIVAFSELERFMDTPVKRYSSGMTVRLGFAVASCIEPEILLVDEVLAVGDASFREKCMQRIQTLVDNGTSIIFVSHNLYLVQAVCQQALYIVNGVVKERGDTAEVIKAYERDLHHQRIQKFQEEGTPLSPEDSELEITKVEVIGLDGTSSGPLRSDQPAQLRIHYSAYQPLGPVSVAAHITRSDGVTCCMMRTSLDDVRVSLDRGGGIVSVNLDPLQLISGAYFAEGHFLNESDSMPIISGRSEWFQVEGEGLSYEERSGVYRPHTTWQHRQSEPAASAANGYDAQSYAAIQVK